MEKYRKFSDPATGINPFLPAYSNCGILYSELALRLVFFR